MKTEYTIISCVTTWELEDRVNREIADGWEPLGGVAVSQVFPGGGVVTHYCQAMVRHTPTYEIGVPCCS